MSKFQPLKFIKKIKVKSSSDKDIEFNEILLDKLAQKNREKFSLTPEERIEKPFFSKKFYGFLLFIFFIFFTFFVKTFYLQIIEGDKFSALAERNKFTTHHIQAKRGVIYDQSLNQLVFNKPSFDLILDIRRLPFNKEKRLNIFKEVSRIIEKDISSLKDKIKKSDLPEVLILENLDHQMFLLLETKIDGLTGFQIQENTVRYYKNGEMFSHLVGHTGKITLEELREGIGYSIFDWVGRKGIEKYYENILRATPGETHIERDVFGSIISRDVISVPKPGKSLVLWLDSDLQKKATEELRKSIERVESSAGVFIALDPDTGGILALVSYPKFDNNLFQGKGDPEELRYLLASASGLNPLFNRAVSGRYAPGSTIKPFFIAAALEEELITSRTRIFSDGKIEIPHRYDPNIVFTFRDAQRQGHGWTDAKKAIAESVNTFFYAIGGGYGNQDGLGPYKMKEWLEKFGWGQRTGIDLPGEAEGLLPSPKWRREVKGTDWRLGDSFLFSIGQGDVLVTPLQLAVSTLAIANDGVMLEPQVVKKIIDSETREDIEVKQKRVINKNFISPENIEITKQGMRQTVTAGTGRMLNNLPVKVAAKTGTAETSKEGHYHHWITVFAPYDDPEIVFVVMIEEIEGIRAATLPVSRAVLDWYFNQENKNKNDLSGI